MNRKKITKAAVTGLVAVSMVPAMAAPIVANAEDKTNEATSNEETVVKTQNEVETNDVSQSETEAVAETQNESETVGEEKKIHWKEPVKVIYYDVTTETPVHEETMYIFTDQSSINVSRIPVYEGYEFDGNQSEYDIDWGWPFPFVYDNKVTVNVKPVKPEPTTKEVQVFYLDDRGNQWGMETVTIDKDADKIDTSILKDIPEDYEIVNPGEAVINENGWIDVLVQKKKQTKEVQVFYLDNRGNQWGMETVTIDKDADKIDTSILKDIPEDYEIVNPGEAVINENGWIDVLVQKKKQTKEVQVFYIDDNGNQWGEEIVTVDKDAKKINTSILKNVPEGYEIKELGDVNISEYGWVEIGVRKIETTKQVQVFYIDDNGNQWGEEIVIVDKDAEKINTSILKNVPEGYEIKELGDVNISEYGWVEIGVRKIETTKQVQVFYIDDNGNQWGEEIVIVDRDAEKINTSILKNVPEGYEIKELGDVRISEYGWIEIGIRPIATTQTVGLNYWDVVNNKQVAEGSVVVDADANNVNTTTFTDIPEGYELVWTGDLAIMDGWVWVEVRPVEEVNPETFFAQLNVQIVDRETGDVLKSYQFLSDEKGTSDATYTFVYGEDWKVEAPEGYTFVEGTEFGDLDVAFGAQSTVECYVEKSAEEPTQPGDEEDTNKPSEEGKTEDSNKTEESEKTDGTKTGVAMSLAGVFGTMSVALAGMVALLRRKQK